MIEKTIRIDFFKPYKEKIEIAQGTKESVIFHLQLTGNSLPIDLTACGVVFYAKKPDGNIVFNDCVISSATAGKADYTVTEQTAILSGDLECWIVIIKTGETLHSQKFIVTVKPVPDYTAAVESTSEFTALETALAYVAGLIPLYDLVSNKNYIINGNFKMLQRGVSQASNGYGSDDRWNNGHVGSTKTHSVQAFTPGQKDVEGNPVHFSRTVVSSVSGAGNFVIKAQLIEDVSIFSDEPLTLSFWAKADSDKYIAVELAQNFGAGGSAVVVGIGAQKVALTTSWQKYEITINVPSISGKTIGTDSHLQISFWFDAGSNFDFRAASLGQQSGTFDIANVKAEKGSHATPAIYNDVDEQMKCYRYYWQGAFIDTSALQYGSAGAAMYASHFKHYVPMRKTPTPSIITAPNYNNCSNAQLASDVNTTLLFVNVTATGVYNAATGVYALDAEI